MQLNRWTIWQKINIWDCRFHTISGRCCPKRTVCFIIKLKIITDSCVSVKLLTLINCYIILRDFNGLQTCSWFTKSDTRWAVWKPVTPPYPLKVKVLLCHSMSFPPLSVWITVIPYKDFYHSVASGLNSLCQVKELIWYWQFSNFSAVLGGLSWLRSFITAIFYSFYNLYSSEVYCWQV